MIEFLAADPIGEFFNGICLLACIVLFVGLFFGLGLPILGAILEFWRGPKKGGGA